jgi:hypothetical protein
MSTNEQPAAAQAPAGMRGEIQKQWSKFTYAEISALKSKDDLVAQVQSKYTLDRGRCVRQRPATLITRRAQFTNGDSNVSA